MTAMKYWLWLAELKGVPGSVKLQLLHHFTTPEKIYFSESGEYLLVEGVTRQIAELLENKSLKDADRILGDCERLGLRILTLHDAEYPDRLRNIYDPPILLYVKGRLPLFDDEVVIAMVGSRKASDYALREGEQLAYQLARHGAVIVSGLAAGGDAAAHRGALRAGGFTVGVIAGGHDVVYPYENRYLYEDVGVRGVILSEYPPGTRHEGRHFPVRNRIISGLSMGVVVMEAAERSGSLITANRALEQGRDVFAVPGQIGDPRCIGSNRLMRDGAGVVTEAWDVLSHYAALYPHKIRVPFQQEAVRFGESTEQNRKETEAEEEKIGKRPKEPQLPRLDLSEDHGFTAEQVAILKTFAGRIMHMDDLVEESQVPMRSALAALSLLEAEGIVTSHGGKRYSLAVTLA